MPGFRDLDTNLKASKNFVPDWRRYPSELWFANQLKPDLLTKPGLFFKQFSRKEGKGEKIYGHRLTEEYKLYD